MDNIKLRILTRKSEIIFKNGLSDTVENILNRQPRMIAAYYFLYEKISFTEEILNEAGINERIEKPGINREIWEEKYRFKQGRQRSIFKTTTYHNRDKIIYNKSKMAWKNQGH